MGQKVNPTGIRLGYNQNWHAHWFATKNYALFLREDDTIHSIINKKYPRSGIEAIDIYRNRGEVAITIHTAKPGIIIGRSGVGAQELKVLIEKPLFKHLTGKDRPNIRISILEVKGPELSAKIVAENIAVQIERRISVKRAIKQAIERTMEKRAKGIKIKVSGRLGGAEIARAESASAGTIPLQTIRSNISYALAEAKTTYGIIGIKVWIYLGVSDSIDLDAPTEPSLRHKSR